ncbi:MAG: GNAT family N-acetyltransferase [Anaerolineae bacterium]|nr:GNAT family N-acetyltransferase [Anaerolineae bacterium]
MKKAKIPYHVRRMRAGDITIIAAMERQIFAEPWPLSAYIQELYFNPDAHYFVVELADMRLLEERHTWKAGHAALLLGYIGLRVMGTEGHISTLGVSENWRGRGLGELLLLSALDEAVACGVDAISLEVRVLNEVAQALYSKYGFTILRRLTRYYRDGEDAYLMRLAPVNADYRRQLVQFRQVLHTRLRLESTVKSV